MTDWWTTGTSIASAAATVGAVAVALWVAIRDGEQRNAEKRDAEAAQARLILSRRDSEAVLIIHNNSQLPVIDVELYSVSLVHPESGKRIAAAKLRRTDLVRDTAPPPLRLCQVLQRGGQVGVHVILEGRTSGKDLLRLRMECHYGFTDSAGLRWERRNNEPPVRIVGWLAEASLSRAWE
ncbi:hypothetical protein ACH41H_45245 [Streptomyces sp. NPDC020800]|uniref:hypothetical protein n=1 Tax=Streptomyces sp. NPDC020800 TaxID=3365092 RepID=UPI0037AB14C8